MNNDMSDNSGDNFQQETKYNRKKLSGGKLDWNIKPSYYKEYPSAERIKLDLPDIEGGTPLWDVIRKRRSVRNFSEMPINLKELSQLLWAIQGITAEYEGYKFRTSPSAGALYPVETYLVINSVENIQRGIFHYAVKKHELEMLRKGDFRADIANSALGQDMLASCNVVFIWSAMFERSKWKYRQRAYRYVYLDAGHIAQNLALASVSMGFATCQIAAFFDDEVNELIGIDGVKESTIYMSAVGMPAVNSR